MTGALTFSILKFWSEVASEQLSLEQMDNRLRKGDVKGRFEKKGVMCDLPLWWKSRRVWVAAALAVVLVALVALLLFALPAGTKEGLLKEL
jgi:hypothetical protein